MSFNTSVSGIISASADLGIIGNNIANASTAGFKEARGEFTDIYATAAGGGSNTPIGQGVKLNSVTQNFAQGNLEFTQNSLDLAINGNGFFQLSDGGVATYSRAGSFQIDQDGYLVNGSSMRLQGFPLAQDGTLDGTLGDIQLNVGLIEPEPTSAVSLRVNVDSRVADPLAWDFANLSADMYNHSTSMSIYDSLGNPHVLTLYFMREGANNWTARAAIDGEEMAETLNLPFLDSGALNVDPDDAATLRNLTIAGWTPKDANGVANGAAAGADATFTIDLNNVTQFGAEFSVGGVRQDGYASGELSGVEIDENGVLFTRYTNGQIRQQSQVVLASFTNPNGLKPVGDTAFVETSAAGAPTITTPGVAGTGTLQSGALEGSNVEITAQLVRMIVAQRNFQANAQMIQTNDTVTQTVINLR